MSRFVEPEVCDRRGTEGTAAPAVKICGITTADDARLAVRAGAVYLGLNFFGGSPRCVSLETACRIRDAVAAEASLVGVFVNHPLREIEEIDQRVGLDVLQFHGDERPEDIAPFAARAVRAFRIAEGFDGSLLDEFPGVQGYLFDAPHATLYGGSGESWSYQRLRDLWNDRWVDKAVWVAGGIRPTNVREVIEALPMLDVLDVCSGVESSPGMKDPILLEQLFSEVRHGEDRTPTRR